MKTFNRDVGQIWRYMLQFTERYPKSKFYLGVECGLNERFKIGELGEIIEKLMKTEGLGLIIANRKHFWVFEDYESFITAEDSGSIDRYRTEDDS